MIWGAPIAWYLFLAGVSAGAFIATAYLQFKHPEAVLTRKVGRLVSLATIGIGLILLMVDAEAGLHNPLRFFYLIMNPESVMTLGVYALCAYMPVALIVCALDWLNRTVPRALTIAGVVLSVCVAAYTGFLLGVVEAFPLWNNSILPILFLVSASSAGIAAVCLGGVFLEFDVVSRMHTLKKSHTALALVEITLIFCLLVITSQASKTGAESVQALVSGGYSLLFWGGLIAVGLIMPLALETITSRMTPSPSVASSDSQIANEQVAGSLAAQRGLAAVSEIGVLTGGFLLRFLIVSAALPIAFIS